MRVLVTGSRDWSDPEPVREVLEGIARKKPDDAHTLVHGAARGLDTIAAHVAETMGWVVEAHPADWNQHGKAAGHLRNQAMVDLGADICLAFPLPASRGTWDCIRRADKAGIPILVLQHGEWKRGNSGE